MEVKSVKSHRRRFSRHRFNQIMLNDDTISILESFKYLVPRKANKKYPISFNDVIIFLIKELMKNKLKYKIKSYSVNYKTKNVSTKFTTPIKSVSYNVEN